MPEEIFNIYQSQEHEQECYASYQTVSNYNQFYDYDTNVNVRTGFSRKDYEYFRPGEYIPQRDIEIMRIANKAYENIPIVKSVIDLMADFGSQGILLCHPDPKIQSFYRSWFTKVKGDDRSERFLNNLYKFGNVIVQRLNASISRNMINKFKNSIASDITVDTPPTVRNEIPYAHIFKDPRNVKVIDKGFFHLSLQKPKLGFPIPHEIVSKFNSQYKQENREFINKLPKPVKDALRNRKDHVEFDMEKIELYHYKKDDWDLWAKPLIYVILNDLARLEKTKLADMAALDGVVSQVRLWTVGNLEHKIPPKAAAINKLIDLLGRNVGGGSIDLVWGPELSFKESATDAYKFLGIEKYRPVYNDIYEGLGVPPTLTGSGGSGGTTNNFISLKTLIERLNYGRDVLVRFWENELRLLADAVGIREIPTIRFAHMTIGDESSEKALWIQLADRGIISMQTVVERFGEDANLERSRLQQEKKEMDSGERVQRGGPWNDPNHPQSLEKIALQKGSVAPRDVGLKSSLPDPIPQGQGVIAPSVGKPKGIPQQGRPRNSNDKQKRKTREFTPAKASLLPWIKNAQAELANRVSKEFLSALDKPTLRHLDAHEFESLQNLLFSLLLDLSPFCDVSTAKLKPLPPDIFAAANKLLQKSVKEFEDKSNKKITLEEKKLIMASIYMEIHE